MVYQSRQLGIHGAAHSVFMFSCIIHFNSQVRVHVCRIYMYIHVCRLH